MEKDNNGKIAFLLPNFAMGGIEKVVLTLVNHIAESKNIILIVMQKKGELVETLSPKVEIVDLKCPQAKYLFFYLGRYLLKENITVLYTVRDLINIIALLSTKFYSYRTKVVISQHNYFYLEDKSNTWKNRVIVPFLIKKIYPFANKIIAVSVGVKDFLSNWSIPDSKIKVIYNPIDAKLINTMATQKVNIPYENFIIFVGRLSSVKNISLAIEAFALIKDKFPDLYFLILGDGELYDSLKEEIIKEKYEGRICLYGNVVNPYPYMKKARALLLPSFSECCPMVVIEGLILQVPVVCTPSKGSLEILGENYKYISTSFDNAIEYADLIDRALSENDICDVNLLNFDIESVTNKYLNICT